MDTSCCVYVMRGHSKLHAIGADTMTTSEGYCMGGRKYPKNTCSHTFGGAAGRVFEAAQWAKGQVFNT